jgi:hypothetical protein
MAVYAIIVIISDNSLGLGLLALSGFSGGEAG